MAPADTAPVASDAAVLEAQLQAAVAKRDWKRCVALEERLKVRRYVVLRALALTLRKMRKSLPAAPTAPATPFSIACTSCS